MDVEKIKIAIDTGELQKAKDLLDGLEKQGQKTDKTVKGLGGTFKDLNSNIANTTSVLDNFKSVIGAAVATQMISSYIKLSDTFTQIESKLKLATKSSLEFATAQSRLFTIAQNSRVGFADTADLYSKLSISTKELNISQNDLLKVTESINKAGIIGGGSKESINAALMQLGQGFSSGTLRGEELNSVLEQTPRLARAIAEGMGVTVGELKKLGEQGLITSDKVVSALLSQGDALSKEFSMMKSTVAQSMTLLENSMVRAVGQMDGMTNASNSLGSMMRWLSKGIDTTSDSLREYELRTMRIQDLRKISSIEDMKKAIELIEDENKKLTTSNNIQDVTYRGLLSQTQIDAKLIDNKVRLRDLNKQLAQGQEQLNNSQNQTTGKKIPQSQIDSTNLEMTVAKMSAYEKKQYEIYMQSVKWIEAGGQVNDVLSTQKKQLDDLAENENKKLGKEQTKYQKDLYRDIKETEKAYQDIAKEGMTGYDKKLYEIKLKTVDFIEKTGDVVTGLREQQKAEDELNKTQAEEKIKERNAKIEKGLVSQRASYDLKEKQLGLLDDENEKNRQLAILLNERQKKEITAKKDLEGMSDDMYQQQMQYEDDLLAKSLQRYSTSGQIIESVSSGMKSSMMDFMDYTSSGFKNLKKLALDLGNMIYKAVTQQMIVNPLVNALSSAATSYFSPAATTGNYNGVSSSAIVPDSGYTPSAINYSGVDVKLAKGGVYSSPSLSNYNNQVHSSPQLFAFAKGGTPSIGMFGEAGSEAIMPLTRDSSGSLGVKAVNANSNSNGVVKVEVINQTSGQVQVTNTSTRNDLEGTVLSIVIGGIQNNKMGLRTMLQR